MKFSTIGTQTVCISGEKNKSHLSSAEKTYVKVESSVYLISMTWVLFFKKKQINVMQSF